MVLSADYKFRPPQHQVFINFREVDVRGGGFFDHLEEALKTAGVNVYGDELTGKDPGPVCNGIEDSRIALVIFSRRYTESKRCLEELVKIKEGMEEGVLMVIPIFYKLDTSVVEGIEGGSSLNLLNSAMRDFEPEQLKIWREALDSVSCMMGFQLYENSDESKFITRIVMDVKRVLVQISMEEQINKSHDRLSELQEDAFIDSSKSEMVDGENFGILWDAKSDVNPKEIEGVKGEAIRDGNLLDEATLNTQNSIDNKIVNSVYEQKKKGKLSKSSTMVTNYRPPPNHKVFINFRGTDLRHGFVSHLVEALKIVGFNVYRDEHELSGGDLTEVVKNIEESRVALVIFSSRYTESKLCLDELVKIKECMDEGKLLAIPIFYKVEPLQVKQLEGNFGVRLWNLWRIHRKHRFVQWKEALESVGSMMGFRLEDRSSENVLISAIVEGVILHMITISLEGRKNPSFLPSTWRDESTEFLTGKGETHETYLNIRMEQLEEKLEFDNNETRIIGVVGMPSIGKTSLAMMLHEKWNCKFVRCMPLLGIRNKSKDYELKCLRKTLLEVLLEGKFPKINDETTHDSVKDILLQTKVFVVLDDVSDKKQLDFLLGNLDWIKKGSKIVITTSDKSLLEGFAHDTYVVPLLNDREAFQLFTDHAFADYSPTGTFLTLSRMFVDYARGHPLALILQGSELLGKDEAYWEQRLGLVTDSYNKKIQNIWRFSVDQLSERQKDVFLDIVYFFISEDEYFVRSLLDMGDLDDSDAVSELRVLIDKFLITISDGRVVMNDLLYRFAKGLGSPCRYMLWNYEDICKLKEMNETEANDVRGIFLDMSEVTENIALESMTFTNMSNLRYLKIYDSGCPRQCKANSKIYFPEGFEFPLEEVRYLHWVKYPLEELPQDFRPEYLVDLRLPYSKIKRVWDGVKDTPRLKWVDLSHSSSLLNLSALSKAENLQRLNLEGCTNLEELPGEIHNMNSLVFLNLRGCIRLLSLPEINLISLKTLIVSGCANLEEFHFISENLEVLHLDGTAIKELPPAIKNLQRLIFLNLKNCKMLECLPNCLRELKALEELVLSGCSKLKNVLDVRESMKHLQSLLIDGIGAIEMPSLSCVIMLEGQASADMVLQPFGPSGWPRGVNGVSSLQRLCLSGNDFVSLQSDIGRLYSLKWLDVKECKKLRSLPMLPPKLQYFDAHGCDLLETVANPLALSVLTEQNHATFNFSNCNKLDQDAKDSIISYTRWKSQLVLDALSRYSEGSVLEAAIGTCFPGWEIPAWFSYRTSGSLIKPTLRPHWCDNRFIGIALCAVIQFPGYLDQRNCLLVTCNCVFKTEEGSRLRFSCTVGSWSEQSSTPLKLESSHVFIGYTTMLDNNKHGVEDHGEACIYTEASFEFQVTDGSEEVRGCQVLNSGFRLVYKSNEREDTCCDAQTFVIPQRIQDVPGEAKPHEKPQSHDDIQHKSYSDLTLGTDGKCFSEAKPHEKPQSHDDIQHESYSDLTLGTDGKCFSEAKSHEKSRSHDDIQHKSYSDLALGTDENCPSEAEPDANLNLWKSLENKRVDLFNADSDVGGENTVSSDHDTSSSSDHDASSRNIEKLETRYLVGVELRLKQMEKVLYSTPGETCIVGVVGMPGIGKTTLARILFEQRGSKFPSHLFLTVSKECKPEQLRRMFLKELLKHINQYISDETTHEFVKDELFQTKVFAVLDDVSDKKQLEFLLGNRDWIKKGSKILITTRDMSLVKGFTHEIYVVPQLNNKEAFQVFIYHAFDQICNPTGTFLSLSRMFVDNAGGNPLALKLLGSKLREKDETHWIYLLKKLRPSFDKYMRDVWRFSINQLNEKDVFLDIMYFFRSEDEYFVRSLLDSRNPEAVSEVRDLADKFLITVSSGQVEMHDQLYNTLGKELGSPGRYKLWNYKDINYNLRKMKEPEEANNVRGIFLDMSKVTENIAVDSMTFTNMLKLRYLKIFDSGCPRQCKADCKIHFPDGIEFPLEEVRYLHWVKYPLAELPQDFRPENLVDLRLPYSNIERVWDGVKDTPQLKWVDLRHSIKLHELSALSKAVNLQRLDLEGCTVLDELPVEFQHMKSLLFLNLRGCIRLWFLPKMNLISLKTLILSDCSNLKEFQLISESLEILHLDGTAIKELPFTIKNLQKLLVLNLKNCKMLECLPNCLGELKALEELLLSGCSKLKNVLDVRESMKHLQSLLIDGIGAIEMPSLSCVIMSEGQASADMVLQPFGPNRWPRDVNAVSSLRHLSLNGNVFVSLQADIGKLYNLNRLDVKECKMLRSIPMLPPRLQYFDAHGCVSLERVSNPLAAPVLTNQIHASFNFSNCNKLEQEAKDNIISYTRWKSQLVLEASSRYDRASTLGAFTGTCFPGWEVPAFFSHQDLGSVLKPKLPPHWSDNKFTGIALCAVILFPDYHKEWNRLLVKCNCVFDNEDGSHIHFTCTVGDWRDLGKTPGKTEASHVFIGYAGMLDIKKHCGDGCKHTKASFEFQVTDGTKKLEGCEVLKCGFSLLYASDEFQLNVRRADTNHSRAYSENAGISNVKRETKTVERWPDGGHEIVELSNEIMADGMGTISQSSNTKLPIPLPESGRERHSGVSDVQLTEEPGVFISCHGTDLCIPFVDHLVSTLKDARIRVFIDNDNRMWNKLRLFSKKIKESKIAVVIFSKSYLDSRLCLNELVKMDELEKEGKLLVIPVFYKVSSSDVENLDGKVGRSFEKMRMIYKNELEDVMKWETSVKSIAKTISISSKVYGKDDALVEATVEAVKREVTKISGGKPKFMGRRNVLFSALFAAFLFTLFIASLLFTDTNFSAFW